MDIHKRAKTLLVIARKDFNMFYSTIQNETYDVELIGFHAQQAVEKALKAWMDILRIDYRKIHDLRYLLKQLEVHGCDVEELWDFLELSPFAVQFRYDLYEPAGGSLDWHDIAQQIDELITSVESLLNENAEEESL